MHRRLALVALAALAGAPAAGCDEQVTPGQELMGRWGFIGNPGERWRFDDDLTYVREGAFPQVGQWSVDGAQLHLVPETDRAISYDFLATRDHFLGLAQHATGPTTGRLGTYRGAYTYPADGETIERTTTLLADGTARITRRTLTAAGATTLEGTGTWVDPRRPDNSFLVEVRYLRPDGTTLTDALTLWHLDDAIGQLAYERISF